MTSGEVEGWGGAEVDGDELDPEQVKMARREELELVVTKLDVFEFGTYVSRGARGRRRRSGSKGGKADDDGGRFVRCKLVGRDFKMKGVEEREDLTDVQDGGCCEQATEEKGPRGGEADVLST